MFLNFLVCKVIFFSCWKIEVVLRGDYVEVFGEEVFDIVILVFFRICFYVFFWILILLLGFNLSINLLL